MKDQDRPSLEDRMNTPDVELFTNLGNGHVTTDNVSPFSHPKLNRAERRASQAVHQRQVAKALKTGEWTEWQNRTQEFRDKVRESGKSADNILGFLTNNIYSVQAFQMPGMRVLGIRRHDQGTEIPWAHRQRIKCEVLGEEDQGFEVYPPASQVVDQANMFWIWAPDKYIEGMNLQDLVF